MQYSGFRGFGDWLSVTSHQVALHRQIMPDNVALVYVGNVSVCDVSVPLSDRRLIVESAAVAASAAPSSGEVGGGRSDWERVRQR